MAKRLWQHALRLTGDEAAARDVTQSAWYDMIRRLRRLHDPASFRAWAYTITTCKSIDWIKKNGRMRSLPQETLETLTVEQKPETGVDELLEQLDIGSHAILSLYYFEKLSISEIGDVLRIPAGAVVCGILFWKAGETKMLILYATLFLVCIHWIDLMKIFAWQMIHRNGLKREIKRLEIRIAELSETLKNNGYHT